MIHRIKACLNGGRQSPPVPQAPAELASSAVEAAEAGAEAVHLHPRAADGQESLAAEDVAAAVAAVRRAGVPIGVSTGLWITGGDPALRRSLIAAWPVLPDFASVNVGEDGYEDLVAQLTGMGVAVEAGVWSPEEATRAGRVSRILVEIVDTPAAAAVPAADAILSRLDHSIPILLHGEEEACWPLVAHAGRLGLPTRIGFEDTLTTAAGHPATSNAALVTEALTVWQHAADAQGRR